MRWIFIVIIAFHGLIHLLGFVKSFNLAEVSQLTQNISKPAGILWLTTTVLFIVSAVLFFLENDTWWMFGAVALIFSQLLIVLFWQDAKFGTIPNVLILVVIIISAAIFFQKQQFINVVEETFNNNNLQAGELLTEKDMEHLPPIVQKYIKYTGSIGKEKVKNFKAEFSGGIRFKPDEDYMSLYSIQYNLINNPTRLFYIEAKKSGIPAAGLHFYKNEKAIFKIKLIGLFTVVDAKGDKMDRGETVTVFNDMCFIAPASLIDKRIEWKSINNSTVNAIFTNGRIKISAVLYFKENGELVNFISNDRYETDGNSYSNYPWSTPVISYKDVNGYRIPSGAKLIYSRPDGDFTYGEFQLKSVKYNLAGMEN